MKIEIKNSVGDELGDFSWGPFRGDGFGFNPIVHSNGYNSYHSKDTTRIWKRPVNMGLSY